MFSNAPIELYIEYPNLRDLIRNVGGEERQCKTQYLRDSSKCLEKMSWTDFYLKLNGAGYDISEANTLSNEEISITENQLCGFCDYLYYSFENDFSIKDGLVEFNIYQYDDEYQHNYQIDSILNNCEIIRVV